MDIREIVKEVISQMDLQVCERRALLLISGSPDIRRVEAHLDSMASEGYGFTPCKLPPYEAPDLSGYTLFDEWELCDDCDCKTFESIVGMHEQIIVTDIGIGRLAHLRMLVIDDPMLCLLYESLRQNRPVNVFSRDLKIMGNDGLAHIARSQMEQLDLMGVHVMISEDDPYGIRMDKEVICVSDVEKITRGPLIVGPRTRFVTAASRLLKEKGIRIVRSETGKE
jgi:hypothetical protein